MSPDATDMAVRVGPRLDANPRRVIAKLFVPGEETPTSRSRARAVVDRVLALDADEVATTARAVVADYGSRHRDLAAILADHTAVVAHEIPDSAPLDADRRTVIGACFTHEFATEAAALCNPSMAPHPDQSGLRAGQLRFVMTVRCIGEGHISSIGFRTGVIGPDNAVTVDDPGPYQFVGRTRPGTYRRRLFIDRLVDIGDSRAEGAVLLDGLPESFTADELGGALGLLHEHTFGRERMQRAVEHVHRIAASTYDVEFPEDSTVSERLLWPAGPFETHGMEDARLVRLDEEDGPPTYHATYTAYDGTAVSTHLLSTTDFRRFQVSPIAGRGGRNKGLALFPRRIAGEYYALSRWDRESLAVVHSDDLRIWHDPVSVYTPRETWELIQIGNGGSPIETPEGWLVITHGAGPMRGYSLGAILLDLDDPTIVRGTLPVPLLTPDPDDRDGYVPNVVYTCGALLHDDVLTIPIGVNDGAIGFAQVGLSTVLGRMRKSTVD